MATPVLKLNGKEYKAPRPTMGVWRKVIAYDDAKKEKLVDMIDGHIEILALIYGIDADEVSDNIDIAAVIPSYLTAVRWVIGLTYEKMKEIPPKNAEAGQDDEQN